MPFNRYYGGMHILVLTPFLLGDRSGSGGEVSALGLLKAIAPLHRLHMVAYDTQPGSAASASACADMQRWADTVRTVPYRMTATKRVQAKIMQLGFFPNAATRTRSSSFSQACRKIASEHPIGLVLIQFPQMAHFVEEFPYLPTVMDVQDAYSVSSFRSYKAAMNKGVWKRLVALRLWLSWIRYEGRYYPRFDRLLVVSEQDRYGLLLFDPSLRISTIPRALAIQATTAERPVAAANHIGFIGAFSHGPNIAALEELLDQILPRVVAAIPEIRVLIAGSNPPRQLVNRAPSYVTFVGYVSSITAFFADVQVFTAPLVSGGGIKIKILEALHSGVPTVTTSIGAEGIGAVNGHEILVEDDSARFADKLIALLRDPVEQKRMGAAGKAHAQRTLAGPDFSASVSAMLDAIKAAA